jgi:ABC-2 type transport system ATP-binding protein
MKTMIELQGITKQYKDKKVLENLSLSIYDKQVVALVGKNGSGKSTLLKMIGGLIKPDSGTIFKHKDPLRIGYVPEVVPSDIPFTLEEYLTYMGKIRGMRKEQLQLRMNSLLETFHMQKVRDIRIAHFSKGMKQKVTIMQAMLEETDLLILDEPLSGLDPKSQSNLEEVLLTLKRKGLSIVLTCHESKLLNRLVDRVLFIKDYKIFESFNENINQRNKIVFEIPAQRLSEELYALIEIQQENHLNSDFNEVEAIVKREDTEKILLELIKRGASIRRVGPIHEMETEFYRQFKTN